jgi:phage shock protein PspC (stress-responsive transcriptional regulator)
MDENQETTEPSSLSPDSDPTPRETGLHRSSSQHVIGGVAGGLAERFNIDANLVRVGFVVLTFLWGLGAAIYLAMWVLIPRSTIDAPPEGVRSRLPSSKSRWLYYALIAGVVVHHGFGEGLPVVWILFLIALAIVGLRAPARQLSFARVAATFFLIIVSALILVSGVFLGILGFSGVPLSGGSGVRVWQPTSLTQVLHQYRTEFGSATVDLRAVTFPLGGYVVSASVSVGSLFIKVPANVIVNLKTHVGIGSVAYPLLYNNNGRLISRPFSIIPPTLTTEASQAAAPHLTIDAQVGIGGVWITRSATSPAKPVKPAHPHTPAKPG